MALLCQSSFAEGLQTSQGRILVEYKECEGCTLEARQGVWLRSVAAQGFWLKGSIEAEIHFTLSSSYLLPAGRGDFLKPTERDQQ